MTTVVVVGTALAACVVGLFVRRMFRRHRARFENIDSIGVRFYLQMLLENGLKGSFIFFDDMTSERFVQFRKYIKPSGHVGIECHFPKAPWSEPYYGAVGQVVQERGMDLEEMAVASRPVGRFIRVDFGADVDSACQFAGDVFTKVFGLPTVNVRARSHGISAKQIVRP